MRNHLSARIMKAITPSDTVRLEPMPFGVYVGAAGSVIVKDIKGNSTTFAALQGAILPICPQFVMSTGTTATALVGLYEDKD